ncbi:MAG: hypothetical protein WB392_02890 [Methanotrichaceae archaeon]
MRDLCILLTLALLVSFEIIAFSEVSIDYSHNIKGTGTILTDYRIGSGDEQNTETSGKVRGTGDMMNKYLFQADNNSANVTIEDEFVMSKRNLTNISKPTLASYPQIPNAPNVVFTGTAWAEKITLPISISSLNNSSKSNDTMSQNL